MSGENNGSGNGNGNGKRAAPVVWQIIVSAAVLLALALIGAFWSLADPRADIKAIQTDIITHYLTIREHLEFRERVAQDIKRVEDENRLQNSTTLTKEQFRTWADLHMNALKATDAALKREIDSIVIRLDRVNDRLNRHMSEDRAYDNKVPNGKDERGK